MTAETDNTEGRRLVEKMTNRQRTAWARAGYRGLARSNYEPEKIKPFVPGEAYMVDTPPATKSDDLDPV